MRDKFKIGSFVKIEDNVIISRALYDHISRSKFIRVLWDDGDGYVRIECQTGFTEKIHMFCLTLDKEKEIQQLIKSVLDEA